MAESKHEVASAAPRAPKPNLKDVRDMARWLLTKGLVPLPLPNGQKRPLLDGWQTATINIDGIDELFTEGCNIGLRLDKLTDADLDAPEAIMLAPHFLKQTAARWGRDSARHSHHLYEIENSRYEAFVDPLAEDENQKMIVEIRHGHGHQSMLPPSVHPNGELVRWEASTSPVPERWAFPELRRAMGKIAAAVLLIRHLKGNRHWVWFYLGGAMCRAEWKKEEALYFVDIVTKAMRDEEENDRHGAVASSYEEGKTELAGLKKLEEHLSKPIIRKLAQWLDLRRAKFDPLDLDDDSNAHAIFVEQGEDLRYLPTEGKGGLWVFWNDVIWQRDRLSYVEHLAAVTLKKKAEQLTATSRDARFIEKVRRELMNVPGVVAALNRLNWYPEISTPSNVFDANPWLIGLQNGVYDLQRDRLEEGAREHLVSRQVQAAYDPQATCPRWLACLERAQPNAGVRAFLQRLAGSCLLGMQTEHGFVFNWGKGANFKTAYSEVLRRVMGNDYAATPNEELFFKGNQDVPRNYVADIHGMRLLTTNEKNEGSEWNIEFIKRLLGGQELNACRKYCESFSFVPTARIIAAANNKPRLNELDEAVRRRFLLVPWEVTIPEKVDGIEMLLPTEADPSVIMDHLRRGPRMPFERLMTLLLEESDGILLWMLAGARDFITRGLRLDPPASITCATDNYFADEDVVGRFVKDWCTITSVPENLSEQEIVRFLQRPEHGTNSGLIHEAFTSWSQFGKYAWSKRKVTQRLEKVDGVIERRGTANRVFLNLVLSDEAKKEMEARSAPRDQEEMAF
ncbi:MAG: phage/plasmid primase, P4 family [Candidatus Acidiferrales bacterium]